jgi:hypothetical protein
VNKTNPIWGSFRAPRPFTPAQKKPIALRVPYRQSDFDFIGEAALVIARMTGRGGTAMVIGRRRFAFHADRRGGEAISLTHILTTFLQIGLNCSNFAETPEERIIFHYIFQGF